MSVDTNTCITHQKQQKHDNKPRNYPCRQKRQVFLKKGNAESTLDCTIMGIEINNALFSTKILDFSKKTVYTISIKYVEMLKNVSNSIGGQNDG